MVENGGSWGIRSSAPLSVPQSDRQARKMRKGMAVVFVGTHERALDDKGRLVLPAKFRSHFSDGGYISKGRGCVDLHTVEGFEEMASRLTEQMKAKELDVRVASQVMASAEEVRLDAQGRVTLSLRLREFASLEGEVAVCGFNERISIWNATEWASMEDDLDPSVVEALWHGGGI